MEPSCRILLSKTVHGQKAAVEDNANVDSSQARFNEMEIKGKRSKSQESWMGGFPV
jgi:hypothetical protein